ncbi:MAG: hypothetical protein LAO09_15980 [Acidobacteriia bacterium]|nr:hypothetical protein [Terriglobia bacterium]
MERAGHPPGTILQAASGFSGAMLQLGNASSPCCTAVSVENLVLDGHGRSGVNGILNTTAQDFSYVDHVSLYQILGTGLSISATNSGPYTNINFDTGSYTAASSTVCASISGTTGTRGFRGLTCTGETANANAAILLDSSNNTIEDVRIAGFADGIRIGGSADAHSNVLVNIVGDTDPRVTSPPIYTVRIRNTHNVSDVTVIGVSNSSVSGTYSIYDEVTGTHLQDGTVGMYALGGAKNNGHALFTTSPNAPTWASGNGVPTGTCLKGSLYSCSGTSTSCNPGGGGKALWGCPSSSGWVAIK